MKLTIIVIGLVLLARDGNKVHLFFPEADLSHPKPD